MIRVLVVEDEPVAAQAHRLYVERVAGFEVIGVVHTGTDALRFCERNSVDLILLDMYLPDTHGIEVCRSLRAAGRDVDVIAVTSARDIDLVKTAMSVGVVQYLLKPFTFAGLHEKLVRYKEFRGSSGVAAEQADVDRMFGGLRSDAGGALPKGMSAPTLDAVRAVVTESVDGVSAASAGAAVGVSRVTARRYLEYLADNGFVRRAPHYGNLGRPEVVYFPF
jgi:response regulator of citrate/malate metabolism